MKQRRRADKIRQKKMQKKADGVTTTQAREER